MVRSGTGNHPRAARTDWPWVEAGKPVGRKIESGFESTEFEPTRKIVPAFTKPFAMRSTVAFELLAVTMTRRQSQNDVDDLRDLMDADAL